MLTYLAVSASTALSRRIQFPLLLLPPAYSLGRGIEYLSAAGLICCDVLTCGGRGDSADLSATPLLAAGAPPVLERQQTQVQEPVAKKRGRPPKAKAEAPPPKPPKPAPKPKPTARKKPPPPESESDSREDIAETLRNVYNHVAKPDMETAIL